MLRVYVPVVNGIDKMVQAISFKSSIFYMLGHDFAIKKSISNNTVRTSKTEHKLFLIVYFYVHHLNLVEN